jgi:predicted DNA-binding protein
MNPVTPTNTQTVSIPLSGDTVKKLAGQAERRGQTIETYLQHLANERADSRPEPTNGTIQDSTATVAIHLQPESEQRLREKAREVGLSLEDYLEEIAEAEANRGGPNDRLQQEIAWLTSRTPEEIEETRRQLIARSRAPTPIPDGMTLSDMVEGKWPGDETDEQVYEALEKLS